MSLYEEEEEEWINNEEDDELPIEKDIYEAVAPRIFQDRDQAYYEPASGYGILSTTAEGEFGKKLKKLAARTRSPEEKFRDNVNKISAELSIPRQITNDLLKLIPRIPDIKYKSPVMCLFGYLAFDLIGKPLNASEKNRFNELIKQVRAIKDSRKVSELDIVRYARLLKAVKEGRI